MQFDAISFRSSSSIWNLSYRRLASWVEQIPSSLRKSVYMSLRNIYYLQWTATASSFWNLKNIGWLYCFVEQKLFVLLPHVLWPDKVLCQHQFDLMHSELFVYLALTILIVMRSAVNIGLLVQSVCSGWQEGLGVWYVLVRVLAAPHIMEKFIKRHWSATEPLLTSKCEPVLFLFPNS